MGTDLVCIQLHDCLQAHANADGLSRLPLTGSEDRECLPEPSIFNVRQIEALPVTSVQLKAATSLVPRGGVWPGYEARQLPDEIQS